MRRSLFLFDLDGTLVNLAGLQVRAIVEAFREELGVEVNLEGYPIHGVTHFGLYLALGRGRGIALDRLERHFAPAVRTMAGFIERNWNEVVATALLPGVRDTLAAVRSLGNQAGILSGNPSPIGETVLRLCGLEGEFSPCFFGERHQTRHELVAHAVAMLPEGQRVWIVGDTPADIAAAQSNRLPSIAVLTGVYKNADEFERVRPQHIIPSLDSAPRRLWAGLG